VEIETSSQAIMPAADTAAGGLEVRAADRLAEPLSDFCQRRGEVCRRRRAAERDRFQKIKVVPSSKLT
jgi:hypothetical protein